MGAASPVPAEVGALAIPRSYYGVPLPVRHLVKTMGSARKLTRISTVNLPDEARLMWEIGACGIVTDDVQGIVAARHRDARTAG